MLRSGGGGGLVEGTTPIASGTDKQVQFNDAGTLNGSTALTLTKGNGGTTSLLTLGGALTLNGHQLWTTDNTYDIGANGATRPKDLYLAGNAKIAGAVYFGSAGLVVNSSVNTLNLGQQSSPFNTTYLTVVDAGIVQHGAADVDTNASIVAQTIRTQGTLAGGTSDQAGKDFTLIASPGKGTGAGGKFLFQAAKAGTTGTVVNTANTVFTIDSVTAYGLFPAGTSLAAPLKFTSGTNLGTAAAGAVEYDGVQFYQTIEASNRAAVPAEQYFQLAGDGGAITQGAGISNFFGATSNITLVSGAVYEIEIVAFFLNTTSGTLTWTLTNAAQPTNQNIYYEMSPVTGVVAPPGTATMLIGQLSKDTTAARTVVTGALTDAVDHYARFRILLHNSTGVSLKIQVTKATGGSVTPRRGSYWRARRLSTGSVGTFVA